jgi:MarR family
MSANSELRPEDCNCFVVRSAARHVTQLYDQFLAPVGLHVTQFSILAMLKRLGPTTINALAKAMVMDRTTLGRNVLPLERDGLIRIEASATDGRAKAVEVEIEAILYSRAVNFRYQAAGLRKSGSIDTDTVAYGNQFLRRVS